MNDRPSKIVRLLERLRSGDHTALADLFEQYRDRLRRMVELRLDARLHSKVDASDVLQDGFLDVAKRVDSYLRDPRLPVFLWLRLVVGDRLAMVHRRHLGTRMRNVSQEVPLYGNPLPLASSEALSSMLLGGLTSPSSAAIRAERIRQVQDAVGLLDPIDREVVALRHFEQLSRAETALVLAITEDAAAKRYLRAMKKLRTILATMPEEFKGP
jgi:RNA polymerase sigma-70 factor, ECF subfamily